MPVNETSMVAIRDALESVCAPRPGERVLSTDCRDDFLQKLRQRDRAAFEQLVAREAEQITRLATRLVGWPHDVDDVVQEVFLSAWKSLPRFHGQCPVEIWLRRITINRCRSWHRSKRVWNELRRKMFQFSTAVETDLSHEDQSDDHNSQIMRAAIQQLRQRDRELIVLHYLEGLPIHEIADALNVRRNAIEVRLHRARARLRAIVSMENSDHTEA